MRTYSICNDKKLKQLRECIDIKYEADDCAADNILLCGFSVELSAAGIVFQKRGGEY